MNTRHDRRSHQRARQALANPALNPTSLCSAGYRNVSQVMKHEGQQRDRHMVYVVSLGDGGVWGVDFKEVVTRHHRYFFPTEGRYPKVPPNYIAFRYEGRLQSIHHVESYEIFDNPRRVFKASQRR